jgi:hypothetical protein
MQDFYPAVGEEEFSPLVGSQLAPTQQERPYVPPTLPLAPTQTPPVALPEAPAPGAARAAQAPSSAAPSRFGVGLAILCVGAAAGAGAYFGGAYGAGAGLLLAGGARNTWRAKQLWSAPLPEQRSEAVKSGTMALFGLGVGGWLAYKAYESRRASK